MRTILLYGNDDPEDLEILRARLDLFAGRGHYELSEENGYLSLRLPASLFRNDDYLKLCLEELLTGTGKLSISDGDPGDSSYLIGTVTLANVHEDILRDIKIQQLYTPEEVQAGEDLPFLGTSLPPARRLVLKVDEETASRVKDALEKNRNLYLSDNYTYEDYPTRKNLIYVWIAAASPDDASVFIDYNESDILYGHEELFTYNLTHPKLSRPYNYCIADEVTWEDPAGTDSSGAGQRPVEMVCADPGESWVFLEASPSDIVANNNREGARRLLLQRLDLIGLPYALGQTERGAFCIKIGASRISASIPELLLSSAGRESLNLYVPGTPNPVSLRYARIEYDKEKAALKTYLSKESVSELRAAVEARRSLLQEKDSAGQKSAAADAQAVPVYLCKDSLPLARCSLDPSFGGNVLTFEDCILPDNGDDHSWFAALLQNITNVSDSSVPILTLDYMYLSEGGHRRFGSSELPVQEHPLCSIEAITGKILKILPGATVSLSPNRLQLDVHMNLPADGELIRQTFSLAPKILEACSMYSECYETVYIRPLEVVDDERCLLSFSKDRYQGGAIRFSGYMCNGRLAAFAEELTKAIQNDTFFSSMISSEYSGWFYRAAP